jgi:predicted RNA-binding Zn-ribbon protein involved in translation (DUF1610 family)
MNERNRPGKVVAVVGDKVPRTCVPCGCQLGFSESATAVTSVAKWICPECGTLNEVEIEFRVRSR